MDAYSPDEVTPELYTARTQIRDFPFKIYRLQNNRAGTMAHKHDYIQIWYVFSGNCVHQIANRSVPLRSGDIFIVPPFVPHRVLVDKDTLVEILGCEFAASLINADLPENFSGSPLFDYAYLEPFLVPGDTINPGLHLDPVNRDQVENLLLALFQEYQDKPEYFEINIKAEVLHLLALLARLQKTANPGNSSAIGRKYRNSISAALDYINHNFTGEIYIQDLCGVALMSRSGFSAAFRQMTGKTLPAYINYLRVRKAEELLPDPNLTMTDVCYQAGFNDASYFARIFRKETGVAPSQYRERIL